MKRVFDIVQERVSIAPGEPMFGYKANNVWHTINTKEVWQQAQDLAAALLTLQIKNEILVPEQQEKNCPYFAQQTGMAYCRHCNTTNRSNTYTVLSYVNTYRI